VKIGYWLLAIGFWRLLLSGFVPAAGMRVRVKISYSLLAIGNLFSFVFAPSLGMRVRVKGDWRS
jgi:hypothetical protein